jgi:hypothetical protein
MLRRYVIVGGKLKTTERLKGWETWRDALKHNAQVFQEFVALKSKDTLAQKRTLF